ncbi:hypothetical protein FRC06_003986, partial [Ceratobasidium sp. 370]
DFGWETHAQAGQHSDNFVTQQFEVASSQPNYTSNLGSRHLSHQDLYNLAHEDESLHPTVTPSSRVFTNSYIHSHPPHQQPVSYYGTHYTHQHPQRAHRHRHPQTQYQPHDRPCAPPASSQSAPISSAAPQPRVNVDYHPSKSTPANRFTPYSNIPRPIRSERMTNTSINQYEVAESDVGGWGYTDAVGPPAPDAGGVDRSAPALPVASQLAGLTLAQHNPPGVKDESSVQPPVPPVNGQQAQPSSSDTSHADSSSDTIMPDAFDLIPPKPAKHVPSQNKKKSSASVPTPPSVQAPKTQKSTRSLKTTTQKAGDNNATSNGWTVDHHDLLIRHILDSDENFNNAEKKGGNHSFWKRVSEHIFENKRSPEVLQQRWKDLKGIYQQVKALESFTGGDGDGEFTIDGDDSEATILEKLRGRLDIIHERKPNIDPQRRVKSADIYWNWIRGGDESWYQQMHVRFRDLSTFDRKHVRRSSSLSPLEIDSNSDGDGEITSKSDANTPKRSVKSRAAKIERGTRGLTGLDAAATAAKEFFAAQHSANSMKNNVALERLKLEQEQAKRKWSHDEEEAKRHRIHEDAAAQQERVFAQVRELNKLATDPSTDPALRDFYQEEIKVAIRGLIRK